MKRHKNYFSKTLQYLREHKGIQLEIVGLRQELNIPEKKFTGAFICRMRRQLNKEREVVRSYPGRPFPTERLLVVSKDGADNQEAVQYETNRRQCDFKQSQERLDEHVEICKALGYDPSQLLEGDDFKTLPKEANDASNSSDSQ